MSIPKNLFSAVARCSDREQCSFVAPRAVTHLDSRRAQPHESFFFPELMPSLHCYVDPEAKDPGHPRTPAVNLTAGREDAGPSNFFVSARHNRPRRAVHPSTAERATGWLRRTLARSIRVITTLRLACDTDVAMHNASVACRVHVEF